MPLTMPMWPPIYVGAPVRATPAAATPPINASPVRRRWVIDDNHVRRDVDEREYRAILATCDRLEVAHYTDGDVVTHVCYLRAS